MLLVPAKMMVEPPSVLAERVPVFEIGLTPPTVPVRLRVNPPRLKVFPVPIVIIPVGPTTLVLPSRVFTGVPAALCNWRTEYVGRFDTFWLRFELYRTIAPLPMVMLGAVKAVGKTVATVAFPRTKILLALALIVRVPVAFPFIWKPLSLSVALVMTKFPLMVRLPRADLLPPP